MKFEELGVLESICEVLHLNGIQTPTEIQKKCIPEVIKGSDVVAVAQTGTGKTAAFVLPILTKLLLNKTKATIKHPKALILTPTRELAQQVDQSVKRYSSSFNIESTTLIGGVDKSIQLSNLENEIDVVVATPGRLLDLMKSSDIYLDQIQFFILDEGDMMLDMGFYDDIIKIFSATNSDKQTLLFSATMPNQIKKLASNILKNEVQIEVTPQGSVMESIKQEVCFVDEENKNYLLLSILEKKEVSKAIIFCKAKYSVVELLELLKRSGILVDELHSNKGQQARNEALKKFTDGEIQVLLATDIAARGIHLDDISHVINYNLPEDESVYVHRVGRTARAGSVGTAISICIEKELPFLKKIEKLIGHKISINLANPFHKEFAKKKKNKKRKRSNNRF